MDATLQNILNMICSALADAYEMGGQVLSPVAAFSVLNESALEDFIPGEVFNIAVNAGWVELHEAPDSKGFPLGDFIVEEKQGEWFMSLLAASLSRLRERAARNEEEVRERKTELYNTALESIRDAMAKGGTASSGATSAERGLAQRKIDEYIDLSEDVSDLKGFVMQKVEPVARHYKRGVSYASVRRIYLGKAVTREIRKIVAKALSDLVPCSDDNLLPL